MLEYEIRPLCSRDIFPMAGILAKIGVGEIQKCFETESAKRAAERGDLGAAGMAVVIEMVGVVAAHLRDCEKEIYRFLSDVSGLKPGEIQEATPAEFAKMVIQVFEREEFADFIGVVSGLLSKA